MSCCLVLLSFFLVWPQTEKKLMTMSLFLSPLFLVVFIFPFPFVSLLPMWAGFMQPDRSPCRMTKSSASHLPPTAPSIAAIWLKAPPKRPCKRYSAPTVRSRRSASSKTRDMPSLGAGVSPFIYDCRVLIFNSIVLHLDLGRFQICVERVSHTSHRFGPQYRPERPKRQMLMGQRARRAW